MVPIRNASSRQRSDALQFRLVYLATVPLFLLGTCLSRMLPSGRRGSGAGRSIFGEASAAARTCGSLSLMG